MSHDMPAELTEIMTEVLPPDGAFRHRQHVHLAFIAARRYGYAQAAPMMSRWIRHIAAYQRAPQKYHSTVTVAWSEIVAHYAAAAPSITSFAEFAERYPDLLDKRLLRRHYTSARLAAPAAKAGWVPPDLAAFPWLA